MPEMLEAIFGEKGAGEAPEVGRGPQRRECRRQRGDGDLHAAPGGPTPSVGGGHEELLGGRDDQRGCGDE